MSELASRSTPLSTPRGPIERRDDDGRWFSAAMFLMVYLGIVVVLGALIGQLVRVVGG